MCLFNFIHVYAISNLYFPNTYARRSKHFKKNLRNMVHHDRAVLGPAAVFFGVVGYGFSVNGFGASCKACMWSNRFECWSISSHGVLQIFGFFSGVQKPPARMCANGSGSGIPKQNTSIQSLSLDLQNFPGSLERTNKNVCVCVYIYINK